MALDLIDLSIAIGEHVLDPAQPRIDLSANEVTLTPFCDRNDNSHTGGSGCDACQHKDAGFLTCLHTRCLSLQVLFGLVLLNWFC
jgi:hypothetical protein